MSVSKRLYRVFRSLTSDQLDSFTEYLNQGQSYLDELLSQWEKEQNSDKEQEKEKKQQKRETSDFNFQSGSTYHNTSAFNNSFPAQVVEDLQLFELKPPSSLGEVKKARNNEIKKYHPDRFNNDPSKQETAKQILQIYNNAYDRLSKYYGGK